MSSTGGSAQTTLEPTIRRTRKRDWGFIIAVILAAVTLLSVAWLEKVAWEKLTVAEETIQQAHSETLSVGVRIQESLAWLKLWHLLYQVTGEETNRQSFNMETRSLSTLVAEGRANASTEQERTLIQTVDQELAAFLARAETAQPARTLRRGTVETLTAEVQVALEPILRASGALTKMQDAKRQRLKAEAAEAFRVARRALQSSVIALVVLLMALTFLAYRAFVVPLKSQLDATAAESSRHEKLASIGVLATGVAHEIRNPLTAIKFRLFSLKKAMGPDLAGNEDFTTIRSEIDRLESLVKNFLEFAKPAEPQRVPLSALEVLNDVKELLEPEMTRRNIRLEVDSGEGLDFEGDRQQLRQVLINLAQNARDSMIQGGTITLRARSGLATFGDRRRPAVLLDVTDTGTGIDPEVQKRLFEPFFSTKEGGTGLGLAIASRIIEQHGGLLQFSTRKNLGSTFTVVLPQQSETAHV